MPPLVAVSSGFAGVVSGTVVPLSEPPPTSSSSQTPVVVQSTVSVTSSTGVATSIVLKPPKPILVADKQSSEPTTPVIKNFDRPMHRGYSDLGQRMKKRVTLKYSLDASRTQSERGNDEGHGNVCGQLSENRRVESYCGDDAVDKNDEDEEDEDDDDDDRTRVEVTPVITVDSVLERLGSTNSYDSDPANVELGLIDGVFSETSTLATESESLVDSDNETTMLNELQDFQRAINSKLLVEDSSIVRPELLTKSKDSS